MGLNLAGLQLESNLIVDLVGQQCYRAEVKNKSIINLLSKLGLLNQLPCITTTTMCITDLCSMFGNIILQ